MINMKYSKDVEKQRIWRRKNMYDMIIIGAGPAGISAGIYAVSRGKKALILEKNEVGGLIGKVSTVTHYVGVSQGKQDIFLQKN